MRLLLLTLSLLLIACQPISQTAENKASFSSEITDKSLEKLPRDAYSHWLTLDTLLLPINKADSTIYLMSNTNDKPNKLLLTKKERPLWLAEKFPHLTKFQAYRINITKEQAKKWLKNKLFIVTFDKKEQATNLSFVQTGNILDDLYTSGSSDANEVNDLGAVITTDNISFKLWAPTAQSIQLLLFNQDKTPATPSSIKMIEDTLTGIWQTSIGNNYAKAFYQYQIKIYHPKTNKIETFITTDPYSLSLSTNSEHSQVINLNDASTKPIGWHQQKDIKVNAPEDNIFYETHIRDFSAHDPLLSNESHRGKYKAFSEKNSAGINHLKSLRQAGINNIHLLPTFDIGTVNEDSDIAIDINDPISKVCKLAKITELCQQDLDGTQSLSAYLKELPAKDESRQNIISAIRTLDNYNWGYDPFHYTTPEGSYALNPDGESRIVEFREMVQNIHNLGFRVIMDVVYNHTHQAGLAPTAVLDKIVPNYYHRLDPISGEIAQSTCCDNTATERAMMEKLMVDSLVVWARDYKIDGFRFDLMAHQPKKAMLKARTAVRAVDEDTYFYGEGWNFGEVANNQRFVQASQLELGGTEIGTFTDRLRDAVRGGAFNAVGNDIRRSQGIGSGLYTAPNELNNAENDREKYLTYADQLRISLAGNLANFPLKNANNQEVLGKDIPYGDQPTGYALDPADTINYVSKHDNQTLWDNSQYRLAFDTSTTDRVRMHVQSLAYPILAQGIPFIHMGSELLRSKSFLRDSYDYGDGFNHVDFTKQSNNYNQGLPPYEKDQDNWPLIKNLLVKNQQRDHVQPEHIAFSDAVFKEFIAIRMNSPLFRLTSAEQIIKQVKFHNTGAEQQLGLIVMSITSSSKEKINKVGTKTPKSIVVVFNTSHETKTVNFDQADSYQLHPIQKHGVDSIVKKSVFTSNSFSVPALTTSVFIK